MCQGARGAARAWNRQEGSSPGASGVPLVLATFLSQISTSTAVEERVSSAWGHPVWGGLLQ